MATTYRIRPVLEEPEMRKVLCGEAVRKRNSVEVSDAVVLASSYCASFRRGYIVTRE